MHLKEYFEKHHGVGVLSTADADGKVDSAVYSRPHILDDGTVAFIMLDRLTRHNLQSNPHAAYLFLEKGPGYRGKRFFLTKIGEEKDTGRIRKLQRRVTDPEAEAARGPKFLVVFKLDRELPLVGSGESAE